MKMEIVGDINPFEHIRKTYKVKAFKGKKIKFNGEDVEIIDATGPRLKVRGKKGITHIHPTIGVEYPE